MDYDRKRAELQAAMDLNAMQQAELAGQMKGYQREFRQLELQQRSERDKLQQKLNPPTGVMK